VHTPTEETREAVRSHTRSGTRQEEICSLLGITDKTLRKHYKEELAASLAEANNIVAGKLFEKASNGDNACMFFWLKTRAGYRETENKNYISEDGSMTPQKIEIVPYSKKDG